MGYSAVGASAVGCPVVHFEVGANDDGQLVTFYEELFGWGMRAFTGGGYTLIDTLAGAGINGGVTRSQAGEQWLTFYVETADPQVTLDQANALGGTTILPVSDFGGAVTIAMFRDPDGLRIGLVRALADPSAGTAPAPSDGSGAPVRWFEIMGADPARSQQFYARLFGWRVDDSACPGYATVDTGAGRGIWGGIGGGLDARWATVYVTVPDLEQTLHRAGELGGSAVSGTGVPELKSAARAALYGAAGGAMVTGAVRDPAGNVIGLSRKG